MQTDHGVASPPDCERCACTSVIGGSRCKTLYTQSERNSHLPPETVPPLEAGTGTLCGGPGVFVDVRSVVVGVVVVAVTAYFDA